MRNVRRCRPFASSLVARSYTTVYTQRASSVHCPREFVDFLGWRREKKCGKKGDFSSLASSE